MIRSSRLYVQQRHLSAVCLLARRQQYLFDKCRCCMYSLELLMMEGKTVRNMYSVIPK